MKRNKNNKKLTIFILVCLCLIMLAGCRGNASISNSKEQPAQAIINGKTNDKKVEITVFTITATKAHVSEDTYSISGTFAIKNLAKNPLPVEDIFFGVLDKRTETTYWGIVTVNAGKTVPPNVTVQGQFTIQIPEDVSLEQSSLIFGPMPDITFEHPLTQ